MPFVTITLLEGKGKEYIKAVTDGVNSAVIETMGFPDDDRYQVVHQVSEECLQYQNRTSDRVMMHLVMRNTTQRCAIGSPNDAFRNDAFSYV